MASFAGGRASEGTAMSDEMKAPREACVVRGGRVEGRSAWLEIAGWRGENTEQYMLIKNLSEAR